MTKALATKHKILGRAAELGALLGLEGLTLGRLAEELGLSKSGVYAHFGSKESLQVEVLRSVAERFTERAVQPAFRLPRGEPRVIALFEGWLNWLRDERANGGCLFIAAATELDDREGSAREELVRIQSLWLATLAKAITLAQREGHYDPILDAEQLAFELHGIMLSFHHQARLLRESDALPRARAAFAAFSNRARGHGGGELRYLELLKGAGLEQSPGDLL